MNELAIFTNSNFGQLRTVEIENVPWFVGKDVAKMLGYSNASKAVMNHVSAEDKRFEMLPVSDSQSGNLVKTALINESGLYSLILSSKLPQAKQFKHWVTSEVLPAIRNRGFYASQATVSQFLSDPEAMIALLRQVSDERSKRIAQQQELQSTRQQLAEATEKLSHISSRPFMISKGEPSDDTTSIDGLARSYTAIGYPISRNAIFALLRHKGYIRPDSPLPTQEAISKGYLVIVEHRTSSSTYYTSGVTTLGRLYFTTILDDILRTRSKYHQKRR